MLRVKTDPKDYPWHGRPWPYRYERLAALLGKGKSIADIGAGEEHIKSYLKPSRYYPFDVYKLTKDTIAVDLDNEPLPRLPQKVDYVLVQGVFEYLLNAESVLSRLHQYGDTLVTTCYYRPHKMKLWKRLWTMEAFEAALINNGWKITHKEKIPRLTQYLYVCSSTQ